MTFNLAFVIQELKSRLTVNNDWRSNRGRHPKNHCLVLSFIPCMQLYAIFRYRIIMSVSSERYLANYSQIGC